MKRRTPILLLILLLLTACAKGPSADAHPEWNAYPIRFGDVLAAETIEGFELNESNDVMSIAGLWYATWTTGEAEQIENAQGKEASVYDAQIYLLLKEGQTENGAENDVADWIEREKNAYETTESTVTVNGREYRILHLIKSGADNPYRRGTAAFLLTGANAVTVEVLAKEGYQDDTEAILLQFLNRLHF
jgi:hypothetical protein